MRIPLILLVFIPALAAVLWATPCPALEPGPKTLVDRATQKLAERTALNDADPLPGDEAIMAGQDKTPIVQVGDADVPGWKFDNALSDHLLANGLLWKDLSREQKRGLCEQIMENLIDMELLAAEAGRAGLKITRGGGELRALIIEKRYKSPQAFRRALAAAGMTRDQYVELWQQQALVNRFVDERIKAGIVVPETELRHLYEREKERPKSSSQSWTTETFEHALPRLEKILVHEKTIKELERLKAKLRAETLIKIHPF